MFTPVFSGVRVTQSLVFFCVLFCRELLVVKLRGRPGRDRMVVGFITTNAIQGRIQDFKLEGAHLKKLHRAEGGASNYHTITARTTP
jgi:hypothetical protein